MTGNKRTKTEVNVDMQKSFRQHVPGRVAAIIENWHLLVRTGWDQKILDQLFKRLQSLVVLTNKFGFDRTSRVTRSVGKHLHAVAKNAEDGMPTEVKIGELDALFLAFSEAIHEGSNPQNTAKVQPANRRKCDRVEAAHAKPWLYLLGVDEKRIKGLIPLLEELEISQRSFDSSDELSAEIEGHQVVAVLCHIDRLDSLLPEQAEESGEEIAHPPVVVLAESDDLKLRLHAMRAGVELYLTVPLDVVHFASKIRQLLYPEEHLSSRVMLVEDDPAQADYTSAILTKAGYEVEMVTDPFKVMQTIECFHPDLILMDLYMPDVSGIELTAIIEERTEFADIPIIFLSGEQNVDVQLEALSVGGEDFLAKPVGPKRLISTVHNRIKRAEERHKRLGRTKRRDKVTGLFSRNYLLERLDRVLQQEKEQHKPMGLLFIELDTPDILLERMGIGGVDAILADIGALLDRQSTETDLSARFGDYSFAILTTRHDPEKLVVMAEMIRSTIADQLFDLGTLSVTATVSVGVLPLHTRGEDSSVAMAKVKAVTNLAKQGGGNQVKRYEITPDVHDDADKWIRELIGEALDEKLFEVHYQPMVALHGMEGEFYQTLTRLRTAGQELVPASKFIPTAEQHGLINDIDRWVVEHSATVLAERKNREHAIRFFICQSGSSLRDKKRLIWLKRLLSKHDIGFNRLTFEFRLSDLKADLAAAKSYIEALNEMNISTLISGFTNDTASFQALKHLPVRFVKVGNDYLTIEKSKQAPMIKKLHAEKVVVIAPCVEDPSAIAQLWSTGADFVQGYFIQRPDNSLGYDFKDSVLM